VITAPGANPVPVTVRLFELMEFALVGVTLMTCGTTPGVVVPVAVGTSVAVDVTRAGAVGLFAGAVVAVAVGSVELLTGVGVAVASPWPETVVGPTPGRIKLPTNRVRKMKTLTSRMDSSWHRYVE